MGCNVTVEADIQRCVEETLRAFGWSPASYLYMLAEQEHQQRHQARLRRLLHEAQLP